MFQSFLSIHYSICPEPDKHKEEYEMVLKTKRGFSHPNFGIGVSLYFSCSHLRQYLLRAIKSTRNHT